MAKRKSNSFSVPQCTKAVEEALKSLRIQHLTNAISSALSCKFGLYGIDKEKVAAQRAETETVASSKGDVESTTVTPNAARKTAKGPHTKENDIEIFSNMGKSSETSNVEEIPIIVRRCVTDGVEGKARAFFADPPSITICANRVYSTKDVSECLVHELIHAYDYLVLRRDLTDCFQLACSEVRANRESECFTTDSEQSMYFLRKLALMKQRICSKHEAIKATKSIYPKEAKNCVEKVFEACFLDRQPLAERSIHTIKERV
eukprot:g2904.t1